jgi:hypothetical protein
MTGNIGHDFMIGQLGKKPASRIETPSWPAHISCKWLACRLRRGGCRFPRAFWPREAGKCHINMALGCEAGHAYNFVSGDHTNKNINI